MLKQKKHSMTSQKETMSWHATTLFSGVFDFTMQTITIYSQTNTDSLAHNNLFLIFKQ